MPDLSTAVYDAEGYLFNIARRYDNRSEVEGFVANLTTSPWWEETFRNHPDCPVEWVRTEMCYATEEAIFLNDNIGMNLSIILHELAHYATKCADGHGPIYREAMKKLVRLEMGFHAWAPLEDSYRLRMGL